MKIETKKCHLVYDVVSETKEGAVRKAFRDKTRMCQVRLGFKVDPAM